ncbi:hypothetical protein PSECIP111854_00821 [Pseudoalteromonas sp. CIP111854]|uniref:Lcl C-terminal domain-containing protein n=1 Tax=Pseudoalteromonas holothuriae TaxID=2963714 RepID=A0A9W4QSS5_9GAMM|nr:DUF1566 domain-containing protein [Pseudoalteromonas sp. CIP111854]CAH9051737.1 hypothetical protein PSECIP111854_00821 [Pseudoalteromonas sp. CIP111854]
MITRAIISVLLVAVLLYLNVNYGGHKEIVPQHHQRFTKITAQGRQLTPWQGPWSCVLDNQLSLLWEVKTDDESIHDGYWTYSWYDQNKGHPNFGDCYFETARCDTQDLINRTNTLSLCGQTNWRLPTESELASLLQSPSRPGHVYIAHDYFINIQKGDYWSSDANTTLSQHYEHLKFGAKAVNFHKGSVIALPYRNAAFVILVSDITQTHPLSQLSSRDTPLKQ